MSFKKRKIISKGVVMGKKSKMKKVSKRKVIPKEKIKISEVMDQKKHREVIPRLTDVREAKKGARQLIQEFTLAKRNENREEQVQIRRAANLAANRADAKARKRNLKPEIKRRMQKVSVIYRKAHDEMKL